MPALHRRRRATAGVTHTDAGRTGAWQHDSEVAMISEATGTSFVMAAFAIGDWEVELTPWHDPAVSKRQDVGEHAFDTLDYVTKSLIPYLKEQFGCLPVVLGGFSLGGLFARL